MNLISLASAVTVDYGVSIDSGKWTYRYDMTGLKVTQTTEDSSTQESINLEDLYHMQDKLRMHEQLRMQEQLKMQQELLQKQQLWMQQQIRKKDFIRTRTPQEETTSKDTWVFKKIVEKESTTTDNSPPNFETIVSVPSMEFVETETTESLKFVEDTTETRETKSRHKHTKTQEPYDYHTTIKKKQRHTMLSDHKDKKSTTNKHGVKQTPVDSPSQEIFIDITKHHHKKLIGKVETTTENIFNTLSSQKVNFIKTPVPHQIKYNVQVQIYTLKILDIGMQVFDEMKNKTSEGTVKTKLEELSNIYAFKYKEFLNETYKHEIKTRLGTQKVILDAIDVSDRILKRLVNEVVTDLDNKGSLRENIGTMNDLQREVRKGKDLQYRLLCSKLKVCRSGNGFPEFLNDFLTTILKCDDIKFQKAIDAFTEVAKDTDFSNVFHRKTRKQIKGAIDHVEKQSLSVLRPSLLIIRNIIANKNRPIIFKPSDMTNSRINSTIAFLEILDAFEIKLPRSDANILEWGDLRTSLHEWQKDKRNDVQDIMGIFMKHIKGALEGMHSSMQEHVAKNFGRFLRHH